MRVLTIALLTSLLLPSAALACGPDTDCNIGNRTYRIAMPDTAPQGALIHMHGYRGSAKRVMRNKALRALSDELGLALIAPKSKGDDWDIPGAPSNMRTDGIAEFAFFDALLERAITEHGIPRDRIYASGFSAGGMMVWNLACRRGSAFAGFVPIAGTFWDPVPTICPDLGTHMVHIHGTTDRIVPLAGRPIGPTHQGDVPTALALFADGGEADNELPKEGDLTCTDYDLTQPRSLSFCTHPGGHSIRMDYVRTAFTILRDRGAF